MSPRITIYFPTSEFALLEEMARECATSRYDYLKTCFRVYTELRQAIKQGKAMAILDSLTHVIQDGGVIGLNPEYEVNNKESARSHDKKKKSQRIPLLRPEQQRTLEIAGRALGVELKQTLKALKVNPSSDEVPKTTE